MESQDRPSRPGAIVTLLSDWDARKRHMAREQLVHLGEAVLPILLDQLNSKDWHVRWESAKALGEIGDPMAASSLVKLLQDDDTSVRWAAMGSLIRLGRASIEPLLIALTHDFGSARLREGAHHVLHSLNDRGLLLGVEENVYCALKGAAPGIQAAQAANQALIVQYNPFTKKQ